MTARWARDSAAVPDPQTTSPPSRLPEPWSRSRPCLPHKRGRCRRPEGPRRRRMHARACAWYSFLRIQAAGSGSENAPQVLSALYNSIDNFTSLPVDCLWIWSSRSAFSLKNLHIFEVSCSCDFHDIRVTLSRCSRRIWLHRTSIIELRTMVLSYPPRCRGERNNKDGKERGKGAKCR